MRQKEGNKQKRRTTKKESVAPTWEVNENENESIEDERGKQSGKTANNAHVCIKKIANKRGIMGTKKKGMCMCVFVLRVCVCLCVCVHALFTVSKDQEL